VLYFPAHLSQCPILEITLHSILSMPVKAIPFVCVNVSVFEKSLVRSVRNHMATTPARRPSLSNFCQHAAREVMTSTICQTPMGLIADQQIPPTALRCARGRKLRYACCSGLLIGNLEMRQSGEPLSKRREGHRICQFCQTSNLDPFSAEVGARY